MFLILKKKCLNFCLLNCLDNITHAVQYFVCQDQTSTSMSNLPNSPKPLIVFEQVYEPKKSDVAFNGNFKPIQ